MPRFNEWIRRSTIKYSMKTRTFVKHISVLSSILLGTALQTVAQQVPGGPGGSTGRARFELVGEQEAKVKEARRASENERAQLNQKLAAAEKDAVAAALAENPEEKVVAAKLEAVMKLQAELGMLNFKNFKDVRFTDQQKEQLRSVPPLGYMVLFGRMGPGGMGGGVGGGAGRPGGPGGGR
jgi:hypothetical protein